MSYALLLHAIRDGSDGDVRPRTVVRGDDTRPALDRSGAHRDGRANSADDRAIVARLRLGEGAALEALMLRYMDRMGRLATHLLGSRDAAEDVVQDVFVRVWERRESLDIERSINSFLLTAVRHRALNDRKYAQVRQRYRQTAQWEVQSTAETVLTDDLTGRIDPLIAALPERQQTAIRLRFVEQLPVPAIADVLGISPNATHQLIFRALTMLRRELIPSNGDRT